MIKQKGRIVTVFFYLHHMEQILSMALIHDVQSFTNYIYFHSYSLHTATKGLENKLTLVRFMGSKM